MPCDSKSQEDGRVLAVSGHLSALSFCLPCSTEGQLHVQFCHAEGEWKARPYEECDF